MTSGTMLPISGVGKEPTPSDVHITKHGIAIQRKGLQIKPMEKNQVLGIIDNIPKLVAYSFDTTSHFGQVSSIRF